MLSPIRFFLVTENNGALVLDSLPPAVFNCPILGPVLQDFRALHQLLQHIKSDNEVYLFAG